MPVVRFAWCALLFVALPAASQGTAGRRDAIERAMQCVQAAMTDVLLPVGWMPEQIAKAALARCVDAIEGAVASAVAGAGAPAAPVDIARVALRRELYEYALQVTGPAYGDNGSAAETFAGTIHRPREAEAAPLGSSSRFY